MFQKNMTTKEGFVEDKRRFDREGNPIQREGMNNPPEGREGVSAPEANAESIRRQGEIIRVLNEVQSVEARMSELARTLNVAEATLEALYYSLPPAEQRGVLQRLGVRDPKDLSFNRRIGFQPEQPKEPGEKLPHIGF